MSFHSLAAFRTNVLVTKLTRIVANRGFAELKLIEGILALAIVLFQPQS